MANNNNNRKAPKFNMYWMYALVTIFLVTMYVMNMDGGVAQEVSWTQFGNIVQKGGVKSITVYSNKNLAEAVLTDSLAKEVIKDQPAQTQPFGKAPCRFCLSGMYNVPGAAFCHKTFAVPVLSGADVRSGLCPGGAAAEAGASGAALRLFCRRKLPHV